MQIWTPTNNIISLRQHYARHFKFAKTVMILPCFAFSFTYLWPDLRKPSMSRKRASRAMRFFSISGRKLSKSSFAIFMSKNLSTNYSRSLRRVNISYQDEISLYLQAPRSTESVQLLYTEPVAKGINWNSRSRAILDTARFVESLNVDSPY